MPADQTWSVSQHDTIPAVDFYLPKLESHAYLSAFMAADGQRFAPPYQPVREGIEDWLEEASSRSRPRQAPRSDVSDQRLRTWKTLFETFGFLHVEPDTAKIHLTRLGRAVKRLTDDIDRRVAGANDYLAKMAVSILSRHLLRNPLDTASYPEDTDVAPYRLVWHAMRQLDNRLHWEEMNRVLMHVFTKSDIGEAVSHIRDVRPPHGGPYDPESLSSLGIPAVEDDEETKRRITPWFTKAGFGGLLIEPFDDEHGYRHLVPEYVSLIDEALQDEVPLPSENALSSVSAYLDYLTSSVEFQVDESTAADEADIESVVRAVRSYGSHKIVCLTGLPGTGKTRLAKLVASRLVEGDPYRFMEVQFHESTGYADFVEGFVPKPSGEGFELRSKTLRVINRRARLDPEGTTYVLLIEEFTRANVHALLGELITYIEHRDRPYRLPLSQDEVYLADNLVLLATFNPRDKSAMVLDHAILRRLHQIELPPSVQKLRDILDDQMDDSVLDQLAAWYEQYLDILPFGHATFADAKDVNDLRSLWRGTLRYFLLDPLGEVEEPYREAVSTYPWP